MAAASSLNLMVLMAAVLMALVASVAGQCHSNASPDGLGGCVCDTGFVGDGTTTCGIAHAVGVELASSGTTGAIVTLPIPSGASLLNITAVTSANADFTVYQTDGTSQGALIDLTQTGPFPVTNAAGSVYFLIASNAVAGEYLFTFTYWLSGTNVSDGLVVETYSTCAALDNLVASEYGFVTAPETSTVNIAWLDSTFQVEFTVSSPYERDSAIVLVDTSDFDSLTGDIRVRPSGSCSAHSALPGDVPFEALFQSAPTATSPQALSGDFLAYPDSTSTGWDVTATDCATVQYQRSFALSELGACNNITFATGTDPSTNASIITYSGSVYIHTLQPADDTAADESLGYAKFTQEFPFEVQITAEYQALVLASTDQTIIYVVIRAMQLEGGDLMVQVETQVQAQGVKNPLVQLTDGSNSSLVYDAASSQSDPCLSNNETQDCIQRWVFRKSAWGSADNQVYNFMWTVYDSTTHVLTVPISLNLRINSVNVVVGKLGDLVLSLYSNQTDAQAGNSNTKSSTYPWHVNERIYLRGDVMINPSDVSAFSISYRELWVCYSNTVGYQITLANGGCTDPNLSGTESVHLIANGAVQNDITVSAFRTSIDSVSDGSSSVSAGSSFDAFPLTGEPHVYTIHAKVLLQSNGRKREITALVRRDSKSPTTLTNFVLMPETNRQQLLADQPHQAAPGLQSTDSWLMVGVGAVGVLAVVGLAIVSVMLVRQRQALAAAASSSSSVQEVPMAVMQV